MNRVAINGKEYSSRDATVAAFGDILQGVVSVEYGYDQEHEINYAGNHPESYGMGKITYTASIELYMSTVAGIESAAGAPLAEIEPFWLTIQYFNANKRRVTDRVYCKFKGSTRGFSDEMSIKQNFELVAFDVQMDVAA